VKRIILVMLTVLLVSAIIFGGCAKPAEPTTPTTPTEPTKPPVKPIEWRFASFVPPSDVYSQEQEAWGKLSPRSIPHLTKEEITAKYVVGAYQINEKEEG